VSEPTPKPLKPRASLTELALGRYGVELHRFLLRRLRRAEDADDLAQEVYMRLLRRSRAEPVFNPRAYVYRIAAHVVAEFRTRSEQGQDIVTFDSQAVEHAEVSEPDDLAERLHMQRQLQRALTALPPTHQAVFLLHKRDGHSREEIATKLKLSPHTVEKYLVQAKARMRTMKWDR
jgi:RNA polymerase sigma factor (sigma-70 family)